jgi:hypothetical protein
MPWWGDVLFLIVAGIAIWGFAVLVGFDTRIVTRKTNRTAENMYPDYADSTRRQRRYAREHGGEWHEDEDVTKPAGDTKP